MKILLTDDERMVRLGLISMLDELYPGQHIYREAKNGREMLEVAEEFQPDIAFIDIRMPLMDGLEALDRCKQICPHTQCLVLSGHSSFEYARTSLRHGALDYLLKPVSLEALKASVETAQSLISAHIQKENILFAHYISEVCGDENLRLSEMPSRLKRLRIAMYAVDVADREEREAKYRTLAERLHGYLEARLGNSFQYTIFYVKTGELCAVCAGETARVGEVLAEAASPLGPCVTRIDSPSIPVDDFPACFAGISRAVRARCLYGYGRSLTWEKALGERSQALAPLSRTLHMLQSVFLEGDEMEYKNILARMESDPALEELFSQAERESVDRFLYAAMGCNVDTSSFQALCRSLRDCTEQLYQTVRPKNNNQEIESIKVYIQKNYMSDIGVNSIAQLMGISPNYLSRIFHERVGCKFIDYLTEIRITNAKRLFNQNRDITVKQVSGMVGYISVRHFTKTFSKLVGCLPSEYQAMCQQEGDGAQTG